MSYFTLKEIKSFHAVFLPLAAAFLAQKGMQFIDTVMMGWIGPAALAAGALGTAIFIGTLVFCRGLLSAVGINIVHARGAAQGLEIKFLLHQAVYLSLLLSLPSMLISWEAARFLIYTGQNPLVIADTQQLLHGLTFGIPGFLLFFTLREFISAFALTRAIMVVSLISIPLTFAANYVLIYGKYGFPALGIAGIGYAGAAVGWFMFGCLLFYCRKQAVLKPHIVFTPSKIDTIKLKHIFRIGFSSGIIMVLDIMMFLIAALMMGYLGIAALAAYQIALQCASIAYNLPMAISVTTSLRVGLAYAAKDFNQVKRDFYLGLILGMIIAVIIAFLFVLAPTPIIKLFLENNIQLASIYQMARLFLAISALLVCFDSAQIIIIGALRGLNDTWVPMLISVICYLFIGTSCAYGLAFHTSLGPTGIWYGLLLGMFSLSIILAFRLYFRLRSP